MVPDAVATSVSTTGSPAEYRPWLDGIRALAIFLVLIDHTNLLKNWGLGGTGVGIFFALSGYLITGLLVKEWESTGHLRLKRFYARRFARLMPGLVLSVVVCSALFLLIGRKREVLNGFFAMTYMANYAAIISGHHLSGFGHAWSLAVEEHFYIVWPAVLLLLVRRATTKWHAAAAIAVICILDLIWRGYLAHRVGITHIWLYVGTVERLGAIAAMLTAQRRGRVEAWTAGLLPIGVAGLVLNVATNLGAVWSSTLLALAGTAVVAAPDLHPCGGVRRWLSARWLVYTGVLSYSLYLWHLPIYQLVEHVLGNSISCKLVALVLTGGAAWSSYRWVESPMRAKLRSWADLRFS